MGKIDFKKENIPFTQVANGVLTDPNLSLPAKGLYAYLYSKPEDWQFSADRIAKELNNNRKTILRLLSELKDRGYLLRQRQADGRMLYKVIFPPLEPQSEKRTMVIKKPQSVFGTVPKRDSYIIKRNTTNKENTIATPSEVAFSYPEYLGKMDDNPDEAIQLLAHFFRERGLRFDEKAEVAEAIRRHIRAARRVTNFPREKVFKAFERVKKQHSDIDWSLETVLKKLTN